MLPDKFYMIGPLSDKVIKKANSIIYYPYIKESYQGYYTFRKREGKYFVDWCEQVNTDIYTLVTSQQFLSEKEEPLKIYEIF